MAVKGGVALNQAADAFAASAEFAARFGTTDNGGYVEALYANTLHRGSDAAGKAAWVAALAGGASRGEVLLGFSESAEHQANTANVVNAGIFDINETAVELARLYDTALGRLPDRAGLAAWTQAIEAGSVTLGQAINGFIASAEFQQTFGNLDNASFVSLLYTNALNRTPDAGGLAAWVDALNHGVGRADIVLGFSESVEHIANTASNVYLSNQGAPGLLFA
jgi:hypothetical protein